jgi:hypothetical protein
MHLLIGMIVTALMGKGKAKHRSVLHGHSSPVRLSHSLPGRSRFYINALKTASVKCEQLAGKLDKIEGISRVVADPRTGSITVHHDSTKIGTDLLAAAMIRLLGLEKQLTTTPQPTLAKEARRVSGALNSAVYDKTGGLVDLWSLIPLALIVLGVKKLMTDRANMMPTGITLLWWGYNSLFKGGNGSR